MDSIEQNSHSEKYTKGRFMKRVVLWEDQLKEKREWNGGKRQVEIGIPMQKLRRWAAIFLFTQFSMRR